MSIPQEFILKWIELERKEEEKSKRSEDLQKEEEKLLELIRRKEELEKELGIKFGGKYEDEHTVLYGHGFSQCSRQHDTTNITVLKLSEPKGLAILNHQYILFRQFLKFLFAVATRNLQQRKLGLQIP